MSVGRPILRYHGGKWMLANWIIQHMPVHRIYVEPFGGAASVLLQKPRSYAEIYNDLDADVVNCFRVLRDPVTAAELERQLRLTPWARREFYETYEVVTEPIERARRLIARAMMAFSTTSRRKNRTGFRAKAYRDGQTGVDDWVNYPNAIRTFVARLQGVCIEERPAALLIAQQDSKDTLFYCDPPYVQSTRSSITTPNSNDRAYAVDLTNDDHILLAAVLRGVKGMVMLSGYDCPLYAELYEGWERIERKTMADGAQARTEVLWFNAAAWNAKPQMQLLERMA